MKKITISIFLLYSPFLYANCNIDDSNTVSFETHRSNNDLTSQHIATLNIQCNTEYHLGLNAGTYPTSTRRLSDGQGNYITYQLWQDSSATQEWGDETLPNATYPAPVLFATSNGNINTHFVYGTANIQNAPIGIYHDTVQVTLSYPPYSVAEQHTENLLLSIEIIGTCTIDIAGNSNFGTWPVNSPNLNNTNAGSVAVTCSTDLPYRLGADQGLSFNAGSRHMRNESHQIPYSLWILGHEWGDTGLSQIEPTYIETHPAAAVSAIGTGMLQTYNIYGNVLLENQNIPAGTYRDTVITTIVW